jgi:hypothetical protein
MELLLILRKRSDLHLKHATNIKPVEKIKYHFYWLMKVFVLLPYCMKKFQVTIKFQVDDEFMTHLPAHRLVINDLIEKGVIDHYVVSMQSLSAWITFTADSRENIKGFLARSPLSRYWTYEIDELFVIDGYQYRLPAVQLN